MGPERAPSECADIAKELLLLRKRQRVLTICIAIVSAYVAITLARDNLLAKTLRCDVVSTSRIEIPQTNGQRAAVVMELEDGSPMLRFWDASGNARVAFGLTKDFVALAIWDAEGRRRGLLTVDAEGNPSIFLNDRDEKRVWGWAGKRDAAQLRPGQVQDVDDPGNE